MSSFEILYKKENGKESFCQYLFFVFTNWRFGAIDSINTFLEVLPYLNSLSLEASWTDKVTSTKERNKPQRLLSITAVNREAVCTKRGRP